MKILKNSILKDSGKPKVRNQQRIVQIKQPIIIDPTRPHPSNINTRKNSRIPKIMTFFWAGSVMSWLRYLSVYSFCKLNPDWQVRVVTSPLNTKQKNWDDPNVHDFMFDIEENCILLLKTLSNLSITKWESSKRIAYKGKNITWETMAPINKNDFYKWETLFYNGGFYSDLDILYIKPMDDLYNTMAQINADTGISYYAPKELTTKIFGAGLMASSTANPFLRDLYLNSFTSYKPGSYYSTGDNNIISSLTNGKQITNSNNIDLLSIIQQKYSSLEVYNIPSNVFYPFTQMEIEELFVSNKLDNIPSETIGIHWYGSMEKSQMFNRTLNRSNYKMFDSTICQAIKKYIDPLDKTISGGITEISLIQRIQPQKSIDLSQKDNDLLETIEDFCEELNITTNKDVIKIPKRMHFIWQSNQLSWMRYMSIYSFVKLNPDWETILYLSTNVPGAKQTNKPWKCAAIQDFFNYSGNTDYTSHLYELGIEIRDLDQACKYFPEGVNPVQRTDLLRWKILYEMGGFYSDTDILYIKPLDDYYEKSKYDSLSTCFYDNYFSIGFLGSEKEHPFFNRIFVVATEQFRKNIYEGAGIPILHWCLTGSQSPKPNILKYMKWKYPHHSVYHSNRWLVYPFHKEEIFLQKQMKVPSNTIGIHWFAGYPLVQQYNNKLDINNYKKYTTTYTYFVEQLFEDLLEKKESDQLTDWIL